MYVTIKKEYASEFSKLKLCYINSIDPTYYGYSGEVENPDYIEGKQEYYAYFTPAELDKQWGDDWDDRPYEYNAEIPYDDYYEGDMKVELNIVKIPFWLPYERGWDIYLPRDWGHDNSSFSVKDINAGAVAWVFDNKTRTAIYAGCNPEEFLEKVDKIIDARK